MKSFLENALNRYLALDPESATRIQALDGKIVTMMLSGINLTFQLHFTDGKIVLHWRELSEPDISIKGTPLNLLHLSLLPDQRQRFFAEDVEIKGNMELARHVLAIFDDLEIDWEEWTSQYIGDVPAHQIGRLMRSVRSFGKEMRDVLQRNVNEYVHEEINLAPAKEALQNFFQEVDDFRMDVDRLEARILQLQRKSHVSLDEEKP